jgi:hypothetical protein
VSPLRKSIFGPAPALGYDGADAVRSASAVSRVHFETSYAIKTLSQGADLAANLVQNSQKTSYQGRVTCLNSMGS